MITERGKEEYRQSLIAKLKQLSGNFNETEVWRTLGDVIPNQFMEHKDFDTFIHDCLEYQLISDNKDGTYHNPNSKSRVYTQSELEGKK